MDNLLPGFEPSEADMIQMALDMPLDRKIEKAIKFFQTYCEGAYGAFSGGKDSCVIKELAKEAKINVLWHYNNVTIDPPELVSFIRKHHADVKWNNPKMGLLKRMVEKRQIPTRMVRWCCGEYKEQGGTNDKPRVVGVRIAESSKRSRLWRQVSVHSKTKITRFAPICYWTDKDVWEYIESRCVPYCELYDEGFDRLGCVGCPISCNRRKEFARWPRYEQAWKRAIKATWEHAKITTRRDGKPYGLAKYQTFEQVWAWWMEDDKGKENCVFEDMMEQR